MILLSGILMIVSTGLFVTLLIGITVGMLFDILPGKPSEDARAIVDIFEFMAFTIGAAGLIVRIAHVGLDRFLHNN